MMKHVFWDFVARGSGYNRRFGRIYRLHLLGNETLKPPQLVATICLTTDGEEILLHRRENIPEDVRFEVFTAVTMKNGVFWVVTPCGSCKNRRLGGT
jgi:hypothetical protein